MRPILLALALLLATAAPAGATQLSYIDHGQVWVSTLDGAHKRAISGAAPTVNPGESRAWTEQAQSDDGWIVGVARESGRTGAAAPTRVWDPSGAVAVQSTLGYDGARNDGSLAVPVTLDLAPGGKEMIYTYSDLVYGYPTSTLYQGTWAASTSSSAQPFDVPDLIGSSLLGTHWVGVDAHAGSGDANVVGQTAGQGPFSTTYAPWFHATGAWSVDVAANGAVTAVIYRLSGDAPYALGLFATSGVGPAPTASCDLPATGSVDAVSLSQDGKWLAWQDDRGLVVAPVPPLNGGSPCPLAAAPTVISATGTSPSLGATTLATPSTTTPPGGSPGTDPGTTPSSTKPKVTVPRTVRAAAFAKGLALKVTVKRKGTVTATAKVGRTTIARGSAKARKAGRVTVRLKASKKVARRLSRYRGKTAKLTVKAPGGTVAVTRKLR